MNPAQALTELVEEATRLHKEDHDKDPDNCRRCIDRALRAAIRDARERLSLKDFQHVRWAVRGELG